VQKWRISQVFSTLNVHKMAQISRRPVQHLTSTQNGVDL